MTSSGDLTSYFQISCPRPRKDSESPTVGKIREGHCTQFCKDVFWEIDDAVRRLEENKEFTCCSPSYTFGTQHGFIRLYVKDSKSRIFLYISRSIAGYLNWRAGILRDDGTEECTGRGQTLLQEDRPDDEPFGAWFGPPRSQLIPKENALISKGGVLTFSIQIRTQEAVEDSEIPTVGKLREGHCTQFCKEVFWEIDDAVRRLEEKKKFTGWSPKYTFGIQYGFFHLSINDRRSRIFLYMRGSIAGYLNWRAGLLRADGTEESNGRGQNLLQEERPDGEPFGIWYGPSRSQLISQKEALISGGVLSFSIQISKQETVEDLTTLSRSLKDLYVAGKDCDVSLKVKEKTFGAHRLILGARTPVLAALFSDNMVEAETGVVCVEDCHPEAFQIFLLFVYSGVAENLTNENVPNVYYIADKYVLPALKEVCVRYMLSNLAVDSVCSILALASRHGEEILLKKATEFFAENARAIFRTAAWRKFMMENFDLANELIIQREENIK